MSIDYIAAFNLHGFTKNVTMSGEPPATFGFPFPVDASLDTTKQSLSAYFRLTRFDGKIATYSFYGWRKMGVQNDPA